jgi:hypothetical protein
MWPLLLVACARDAVPGPPASPLDGPALEAATARITALGPRMVGTPGEDAGAILVAQMLRDAGADVTTEPFTWDAWFPGDATLTLGDVAYPAYPLSPSPPVADLVAPLVTGDVRDGVALYESDDISRAEAFIDASTGGAAAMVRITDDLDTDGSPLFEVGHTLVGATLPSLAVDAPTGAAMRASIGLPVRVDLDSSVFHDHVSTNVVGRVHGRNLLPIYVVAHVDSWWPSESAFDNALGVGALVLLAEKLASGPEPANDVVFLATSGEEQGLQGAFAYVNAHPSEAAGTPLVITLDVMWSAEGTYFVQADDPAWTAAALDAAAAEGIDAVDGGDPGISSDHFAFATKGAPVMWNTRWRDRHYHSAADRIEALDFDEAAAALRLHWRVLAEAAGVPVGD